jgi:hypothetical protein
MSARARWAPSPLLAGRRGPHRATSRVVGGGRHVWHGGGSTRRGRVRRRARDRRRGREPRPLRWRGCATTGVGASSRRWSYSPTICGQSVSRMVGASACTALIAAWSWYGPGWFRRRHARTSPCPSAMSVRPTSTGLDREDDERPVLVEPRRLSRVGQQQQGEEAADLRLVRHQPGEDACEADGVLAQVDPRRRPGPGVVDEIEDAEDGSEPVRQLRLARHPVGDAAALILCFARTRRFAMVGSGTRKDRATSAVVSPPSSRSVSAICASGQRRMAAREDEPEPVVNHS